MKKMPVLLTFDVDGETLWLCRDPENANRPVTLSQGRYGPESGVPRIEKLLDKYGIKATFFIPGYTVRQYPEMVKRLADSGHEIGNHGWSHTYPDNMDGYEEELKEYRDSSDIIEKTTGKRPEGYRSPAWEFSPYTIDILEKMGDFKYSSNMMDSDRIHRLETGGRRTDLVELPVHWVLDDAAFWLYSVRTPGKSIQPAESVELYWKNEFDGLLEEFQEEVKATGVSDLCFVLTCHPQIIGRPARMGVLERVVRHILETGRIEFVTGSQAANQFKELHPEAFEDKGGKLCREGLK